MRWILLTLLLAGCGDNLSNGMFAEDELFSAALPQEADLRHSAPASEASEERAVGDAATMPPIARGVAEDINGHVYRMLGLLDRVLSLDITTRERDRRIWGPYPWLDGSVKLTVLRDEEAVFSYRVEVADEAPDEAIEAWYPLMEGTFLRGESLREGTGSFEFDLELWSIVNDEVEATGRMVVDHSRTGDEVTLHVDFLDFVNDDGDRSDVRYFFRRFEPGGGVLEYRSPAEVIGGDGSLAERWTARARWLPTGAGRADFVVRGGDLGDVEYGGTECWDPELLVTYYDIEDDGVDADGVEEDCLFLLERPREIGEE